MEQLFQMLLVSLGIQTIFFVIAYLFRTDKVTDLSYGLSFFLIIGATFYLNKDYAFGNVLLWLLITAWSIRITWYLFTRILKIKRDRRFDGIRESFPKFARFWILQGLSVWIILLPAMLFIQSRLLKDFSVFTTIGLLIFIFGLIVESVADWQKTTYKKIHPEKWTNVGLWKYSRHPNYFGEMLCWWGIFIYCFPILQGDWVFAIIGPIFITILLLFVSGIPLLEKSYNRKYALDTKYEEYKRTTNLLIPFPIKLF